MKFQSIEAIQGKEFLTVRDVAALVSCSVRTAYRLIENGEIKAVNLAQRKTLIKRSEIDNLFEQPTQVESQVKNLEFDISDSYKISEVRRKYSISEKGLSDIIKRNNIPKIRNGRYVYVPKSMIDELFS